MNDGIRDLWRVIHGDLRRKTNDFATVRAALLIQKAKREKRAA
jgi:hypothetical protein